MEKKNVDNEPDLSGGKSSSIEEIQEEILLSQDSTDIEIPDSEKVSDSEAEEFTSKILSRAVTLNGVKIDRAQFLRVELKKHCPNCDYEEAIRTTPFDAGVSAAIIDKIAHSVIDFETKKCAGLSFLSGIPGGAAMAATVPGDLVQYFAHVMRVEQKLAYLYGWQSFLNDEDEVDDETLMELILLMGIMMGVGGAASSITKFASNVATTGVTRTIQRQALTKTTFYPIMKKILRVVGVQLTKETFAKTAGKIVPVIGGIVSGGLTYVSFKPGSERLRKYLRSLPSSGMADIPEEEREPSDFQVAMGKAAEKASDAASNASSQVKATGSIFAKNIKKIGHSAAEKAKNVKAAAQSKVDEKKNE